MSEYSIDENRLANIDEIIQLPADLLPVYEKKKGQAIVGSFKTILRQFHTQMITEGWSSIASALRSSGAIVATRYGLSMVNTDVIPDNLASYVLEHEVVESTLEADKSGFSEVVIKSLGLKTPYTFSNSRPNHVVATFHQMRMAQKDGKLSQMMKFADELELMPANRALAIGNRELRCEIYSLLTGTTWSS